MGLEDGGMQPRGRKSNYYASRWVAVEGVSRLAILLAKVDAVKGRRQCEVVFERWMRRGQVTSALWFRIVARVAPWRSWVRRA